MRAPLTATLALAAALVAVTGCTPGEDAGQKQALPAPPSAASEPARQLDLRDADLDADPAGKCRYDADAHGAAQNVTVRGTVTTPVLVAVTVTVHNRRGEADGSGTVTARLAPGENVTEPLTIIAPMSEESWRNGYDRCATQITWSTLATQ